VSSLNSSSGVHTHSRCGIDADTNDVSVRMHESHFSPIVLPAGDTRLHTRLASQKLGRSWKVAEIHVGGDEAGCLLVFLGEPRDLGPHGIRRRPAIGDRSGRYLDEVAPATGPRYA